MTKNKRLVKKRHKNANLCDNMSQTSEKGDVNFK